MKKTIKKTLLFILVVGSIAFAVYYIFYPYKFEEKTPFTDVYFQQGKIMVKDNGIAYELIKVEDDNIEDIIAFAKNKYKDKWLYRIKDDYMMLMHDMGHWVYFNTNVELKDKNGNIIKKSLSLSGNNRNQTKLNNNKRERIVRKHSNNIPDSLNYLTQRMDSYKKQKGQIEISPNNADTNYNLPVSAWIPADYAIADLEKLEYNIKNDYSYATLKNTNYPLAIDAIISDLGEGITKRDFGIQVKRLLALFGDGHTRVSRSLLKMDSLFLPITIKKVENKYIALDKSNKLLNSSYPEIISIDGYSIDSLITKAGELVAKGSPQFYESACLGYITRYGYLQQQLNIKYSTPATIKLTNSEDTISTKLELLTRDKISTSHKQSHHKLLDGNIGYIYIGDMDGSEEFQKMLTDAMDEFQNTKGFIIDIRGNGGGSRKPIYTLLPYFIKQPKVINVNALRIDKELDPNINEPIGSLEKRMAYPEKSSHWTEAERKVIATFKKSFNPEWKIDRNYFSDWHYSVVSPGNTFYDKPVIVLMDTYNFSASDVFLCAFKGSPNVTLIGSKSSGGSGFTRVLLLENSGLIYLQSRMASFQPNGKLYEGNGVSPDIEVYNSVNDYRNQTDNVLKKAIQLIE